MNAVWILWLSYALGIFFRGAYPNRGLNLLDLVVLAAGNVVSAVWNDRVDLVADVANERKVYAGTITNKQGDIILWICSGIVALVALADLPRFLFVICAVFCGYAYNRLHWSGRPVLSLVLYALYYRLLPFLLGTGAFQGQIKPGLFVFSIGLVLLRCSTAPFKDLSDQVGDRRAGRKTFVIVYGLPAVVFISLMGWFLGSLVLIEPWLVSLSANPISKEALIVVVVIGNIVRFIFDRKVLRQEIIGAENPDRRRYLPAVRAAFMTENLLIIVLCLVYRYAT